MNPFVASAPNPAPTQTGPLGVTVTPQPTFDSLTNNFNAQLNLNGPNQQRLSVGPNSTANNNLFAPTTSAVNPVPSASSNPFLLQGTGQVAAPQKSTQQPSTYNPFL